MKVTSEKQRCQIQHRLYFHQFESTLVSYSSPFGEGRAVDSVLLVSHVVVLTCALSWDDCIPILTEIDGEGERKFVYWFIERINHRSYRLSLLSDLTQDKPISYDHRMSSSDEYRILTSDKSFSSWSKEKIGESDFSAWNFLNE